MRLVLDVENTVAKRSGKDMLDPYEPGNTLVQVGTMNADDCAEMHIFTFDHKEQQDR